MPRTTADARGVTTHVVTSADGTRIGYLTEGSGPGIVLVQGAMADVHAYRRLAAALASSFTVHSVERRGRGLSPRSYDEGRDTASPAFLREAVRTLQGLLPDARHVELAGLGHDGPWNGGAPERVARAIVESLRDR